MFSRESLDFRHSSQDISRSSFVDISRSGLVAGAWFRHTSATSIFVRSVNINILLQFELRISILLTLTFEQIMRFFPYNLSCVLFGVLVMFFFV